MSKRPVVCWTWCFLAPSSWFRLPAVLFLPSCFSFSGDLSSCGPVVARWGGRSVSRMTHVSGFFLSDPVVVQLRPSPGPVVALLWPGSGLVVAECVLCYPFSRSCILCHPSTL